MRPTFVVCPPLHEATLPTLLLDDLAKASASKPVLGGRAFVSICRAFSRAVVEASGSHNFVDGSSSGWKGRATELPRDDYASRA